MTVVSKTEIIIQLNAMFSAESATLQVILPAADFSSTPGDEILLPSFTYGIGHGKSLVGSLLKEWVRLSRKGIDKCPGSA